MGFDLFSVSDFIDNKGLCELNMNTIVDYINNPGYRCPLKQ